MRHFKGRHRTRGAGARWEFWAFGREGVLEQFRRDAAEDWGQGWTDVVKAVKEG